MHRAQDILAELEKRHADRSSIFDSNGQSPVLDFRRRAPFKEPKEQLALFSSDSEIEQELSSLDISTMTPMEAINKLYELQKKVKGQE